jgi:hypothetical protein
MPHQQKLVHIQEITGIAAGGQVVPIAPGLQYDANNEPALAAVRHKMTVEINGTDPGADFRWFNLLPPTAALVVLAFAATLGGYNAHVMIKLFHSICFDISSAEQPY